MSILAIPVLSAPIRGAMHDAYRAETGRLAEDGVLRFPAVALLAVGQHSGAAHGPRSAAA